MVPGNLARYDWVVRGLSYVICPLVAGLMNIFITSMKSVSICPLLVLWTVAKEEDLIEFLSGNLEKI
jgi:hypothetical protein